MTNSLIVDLYKKGYSINYISNLYYKFLNKNSKPLKIDGILLFPAKIYTKTYCRMHVNEIIYSSLLNDSRAAFTL